MSILNETLEGHIFHNGFVRIDVDPGPPGRNGNATARVTITGQGFNEEGWLNARLNEVFGHAWFRNAAENAAERCEIR
jgi:hypothetical protein